VNDTNQVKKLKSKHSKRPHEHFFIRVSSSYFCTLKRRIAIDQMMDQMLVVRKQQIRALWRWALKLVITTVRVRRSKARAVKIKAVDTTTKSKKVKEMLPTAGTNAGTNARGGRGGRGGKLTSHARDVVTGSSTFPTSLILLGSTLFTLSVN